MGSTRAVLAGAGGLLNGSYTRYLYPTGASPDLGVASEDGASFLSPAGATAITRDLSVQINKPPYGSYTFTLYVNGAATDLSCLIYDNLTKCDSGTKTATVPPGATLSIQVIGYVANGAQAARVLRPGGRLAVSDFIADPGMDEQTRADMAAWTGCIAGALTEDEFYAALIAADLGDIEIRTTHRVHATSAMIRARKPR